MIYITKKKLYRLIYQSKGYHFIVYNQTDERDFVPFVCLYFQENILHLAKCIGNSGIPSSSQAERDESAAANESSFAQWQKDENPVGLFGKCRHLQ